MRRNAACAAAVMIALTVGCLDLRELGGEWHGERVGTAAELRVGFADRVTLSMSIDSVDSSGIDATLSTSDGLCDGARVASIPGAQADVLASTDFDDSPERVYFSFVATEDGGGDALALVAIYDDQRIEVRLLRGGPSPLYGIFSLRKR